MPLRQLLAALIVLGFGLDPRISDAQIAPYLNFPDTANGNLPALLSSTGAFSDVEGLAIATGMQAYSVNQPLWSDGAEKFRWAGIPAGTGVSFSPTGKWIFPAGSVLVKHFELGDEGLRVETRFEIIKTDGTAYFLTYRWRDDQSEADLVGSGGLSETLSLADGSEQTWSFPSRIACTACHNDSANPVLGLNTRQLNRTAFNSASNQLADWNERGQFSSALDPAQIATFDALTPITDEAESLERRVRSYLDVNCAICHNPAGSPPGAVFDARFNTPIAESGIPNGRALVPFGIPGAKVIKAQDPSASILYRRLSTDKASERMPPIGRDIVHEEARDLILRWMLSLDPIESLDIAGYLSHWHFDQSLADETGAHDGSLSGTANYASGVKEEALSLSGLGEHVNLGHFDLNGSELTFSLWIWSDALTDTVPFLAKSSGADEQDTQWSIGQAAGGKLTFRLRTGGVTTTVESPAGILTARQWTHVGLIYDGTTMRLFRDGSEVASAAKSGEIDHDPGAAVAIGWQAGSGSTTSFVGHLDELRIYPRALSPSDLETVRQFALDDNSAPTASIDEPEIPVFALSGTTIPLAGSGSDPEDGNLSENGAWISSRDGGLGVEAEIHPSKLSVGKHLIVFTVNDSNLVAASASTEITIVPGLAFYLKAYGLSGASAHALADTDHDGLLQIQEYAFHRDPTHPQPSPISPNDGGIRFPISKQAIDLEFVVQSSPDLRSWIDGTIYRPTGNAVLRTGGAHMERVSEIDRGSTLEIIERSTEPTHRFLRLLVRER